MLDIIPLIGLALVDSLSVGTLVIPLTLLLRWGQLRTIPTPHTSALSPSRISLWASR